MKSHFCVVLVALVPWGTLWTAGYAADLSNHPDGQSVSQQSQNQSKWVRHSTPKTSDEVKALAATLHQSDKDSKEEVYQALVSVSSDAAQLGPVYRKLLDDKDEDVQRAAIQVAGKMKMKEAAPKIRTMLSRRPKHRIIDGHGIYKVSPGDSNYAQEAVGALVELNDLDSIDEIVSRDEFMCCMAGVRLARFGAKALPMVLAKAKKGWAQKQGAGSMVQFMRDEEAVPTLLELLAGPDPDFSARAAQAISAIANSTQSDRTKKTIVAQLESRTSNHDWRIRKEVYGGLLAADAKLFGPTVLAKFEKEDGLTQLEVLYAISRNRTKAADAFLEQFIRDDEKRHPGDDDLRAVAAGILYELTGRKVPYKGLERELKKYKDPYVER
ncbi:MAG: hypothetical protein NTY77_12330 [Elusimicrobia bacterium]|nr:hypothetical protein [Elusimicrobiota bacterium]